MRNLFICHTQAQLILASGLVSGRFRDDENLLILFVDFGIRDELKECLDRTFTRTLYLQSIYPAEFNTAKSKLKWYPKDWRLIKGFLDEPIDRAFAVCDWLLLVQKTLQRVFRLNRDTEISWLEDGIQAYYSDSEIHKGMDSNAFTRAIRRFLFRDLLCVGQFYDRDFANMGGLKCFKSAYVCYPDAVREPYRSHRQIVAISHEEYLAGLEALYRKVNLEIPENSVILIVDKLDRYAFPDKVRTSLGAYISQCQSEGKVVFCKFHPRENEHWDIFDSCKTLDKSVGAESLYLSLSDKASNITVAGIKSTGLMSAKKLGFNVVSLFGSCGEDNNQLITFFKSIDIKMI